MSRQIFNETCDLVNGPGAPNPGEVRATWACRLVPEVLQDISLRWFSLRRSYMTIEVEKPREPVVTVSGGNIGIDLASADRVSIPSGQDPQYIVMFCELVDTPEQDPYWRVHLATIDQDDPPIGPPTPPAPGVVYWWKGDAIVGLLDGDPISLWVDSADAGDASGIGSARPSYGETVVNGLPAVSFDGVSSYLSLPELAGSELTLLCVVRLTSDANYCPLIGTSNTGGGGFTAGIYATDEFNPEAGAIAVSDSGVSQRVGDAGFTSASGWGLVGIRVGGGSYLIQLNGADVSSGSWLVSFASGSSFMGGNHAVFFFPGDIAEMKVFRASISDTDLSAETAAMMTKYGL